MAMYRRINKLFSPAVRWVLSTCHNGWFTRSTAAFSTTFPRFNKTSLWRINSAKCWTFSFDINTHVRKPIDSARIQISQRQHCNNSNGSRHLNPAIELNKKIVELGRNKQWKDLLLLHQEEKESFNNVNYATTMSQLGRIRSVNQEDALFNQFVGDLAIQMETKGLTWMDLQSVANIMHALGKMKLKSPSAMRIATLVSRKENAEWLVNKGDPQAIANTAWAFATLGVKSPNLFAEIEKHAEWMVANGNSQDASNTSWSCATLGVQSPKLFAEIERHAQWIVENGLPQNIANTAWSCATLGIESSKLFAEIEKHAKWFVENAVPQAIANTAWSCATLGVQSPKLFSEIEKHAKWFVGEADPQGIANTAWSCATLGVQSPKLFSEIEKHAEWFVGDAVPQAISNTAWSCGTLGVQSPKLFSEIEKHAEWFVGSGLPQHIANTAWSCATLGVQSPNFFDHIDVNIEKLLSTRKVQHLFNICYAIQILDVGREYESSLSALWDKALSVKITELGKKDFSQLVVVEAIAKADGIPLQTPSSSVRERMWNVKDADNCQSKSQKEVSAMLKEIGFPHEEEVSPLNHSGTGGMLSIDFACKERKIAIEYDGSQHYLRDVGSDHISRVENGSTKAKRRLLERSGWTVINLNYQDWIAAKQKGKAKEWLCQKLRNAGVDWSEKKHDP